jgi:N-acetylmuramoyl-L-alanine amidase
LTVLLAPAAFAQDVVGALDYPELSPAISTGEVMVRGWALDPDQISHIDLYVDDVFLHQVNIGVPRPDLAEILKGYPGSPDVAHPGFTTGFLASRFSNGPHTVYVKVFTSNGKVSELGRRTITIDNTVNQSPFGFVDIPDGGGTYDANNSFSVIGWATDTDGIDRVDIRVDGATVQAAVYGDERPDVSNAFPDFPTAMFSGFVANVDTTLISDGVHILTVVALDRLGSSKMIGRRVIQVLNSDTFLVPFGNLDEPKRDSVLYGTNCSTLPPPIVSPATVPGNHISAVRGWALDLGTRLATGRVGYVELLIDGSRRASTDDCSFDTNFNAYVNCYGLPRFDVQRYYPTYPDSPRAGFMFTLDVGAQIALGIRPGAHVLKVRVGDQEGQFTELPGPQGVPVFFNCAEANTDFASLGFIDRPVNFDLLKGTIIFQGWALDQNLGVNQVEIYIDGNFRGIAQYGALRSDVHDVYPFITNSLNSGWSYSMDTRQLSDIRHRLTVRVLDNAGHESEIGSVDFYVDNAR